MPDLISLSLWIKNYSAENALRHFEELLRTFPFSNLRPGAATLRIYGLQFAEAPILERAYGDDADIDAVISVCREFENPDCAYVLEGWWDLFKPDGGRWRLSPSRVTLFCFAPEFENDANDHLRIEAGAEADFLAEISRPEDERAVGSNVKSLVRLAREIQAAMPVEKRRLWSESGEDLAERLEELVEYE